MKTRRCLAISAAIMLTGTAWGDPIVKNISVPKEKYTCYKVPEPGGAALRLRILRGPGVAELVNSWIVLQDGSDGVQWQRTQASYAAHIYDIGVVLSGHEWVKIEGTHKWETGPGTGSGGVVDNTFKANVAHLKLEKPLKDEIFMIDHDTMQINSPGIICQAKAMLKNDETSLAKLVTNWKLLLSWTGGGTTYYTPGPTENDKLSSSSNPFNVQASAFTTGGDLSIVLEGKMDGRDFESRTITGVSIRMDEDPSNADFSAQLGSDIIRALAWQEGQGYLTWPRWNHYNNETGQPLVNAIGAWGIMNIRKGVWGVWFETQGNTPTGYTVAKWNVMAWNWKVHIANGIYIHQTYMHAKQQDYQKAWPNTAEDAHTPNREDLASYGYLWNEQTMRKVTAANWDERIVESIHVQNIRTYKSTKPWQ